MNRYTFFVNNSKKVEKEWKIEDLPEIFSSWLNLAPRGFAAFAAGSGEVRSTKKIRNAMDYGVQSGFTRKRRVFMAALVLNGTRAVKRPIFDFGLVLGDFGLNDLN